MTETILAILMTIFLAVAYAIIRICANTGGKLDELREFNLERRMMLLPARARRRHARD
jgi:hypothetical protein